MKPGPKPIDGEKRKALKFGITDSRKAQATVAAKNAGISRDQWINDAISEKLESSVCGLDSEVKND